MTLPYSSRLTVAVDDRADAVLELLELAVALGLADLLQDHLLGRLRGDAAELDRRHLVDDLVADLGLGQELLGLLDRQLRLVVLDASSSTTVRTRVKAARPVLRSIFTRMSISAP